MVTSSADTERADLNASTFGASRTASSKVTADCSSSCVPVCTVIASGTSWIFSSRRRACTTISSSWGAAPGNAVRAASGASPEVGAAQAADPHPASNIAATHRLRPCRLRPVNGDQNCARIELPPCSSGTTVGRLGRSASLCRAAQSCTAGSGSTWLRNRALGVCLAPVTT